MKFWLYLLAAGVTFGVRTAAAGTGLTFAWDLSLAPAFAESAVSDDACRPNPYALYRRGCPDELNRGLERSNERQNVLGQLLVLADQYKSLSLAADLRPSTQLKFTAGLVSLYEQEAEARITLRFRF